MITELLLYLLIAIIIYHVFEYFRMQFHYDKWGVRYKPGIPLFGNTFCSIFGMRHFIEDMDAVYKAFPNEKYVAFFDGMKPILLIRDPDLMKMITIKDFNHFVNRKPFFPKEIEPLLGSSILSLEGDEWRKMRSRLTVAFSAAKIKGMWPSMRAVSYQLVDYLKDHQSEDIDVADLMRRYNTDVIANTGMGLNVNSLKNPNNEFFTTGAQAVTFTIWRKIYYFFTIQFPVIAKLMQLLGLQLLPPAGTVFFRKVVSDSIAYRKTNNIIRHDFIHILMEISEDWTLDEITGQIYFAFLASYESTTSILSLCIHELALHPEIEEKLYQEVRAHQEKAGELTLEDLSELKYIDCVLSEISRKWSAAVMMDRVCTSGYVLPPPRDGGKGYEVKPGDVIYNVVNPIHMDPKYFSDPEVFDPTRFSEGNKQNIKSFTYMPFGMGPRNCLGMRFAIIKMKVLLYHLVLNYKIVRCEKTSDPIRLQALDFSIRAVGDTYVQFKARS
ncbi:cytochrome P450 9e2-like [Trichoplusia ni]|uniref:unspecific monooxygenase n=1 Tax=Trichoplusia ni TaxID=7111 RepID=A0A7E5VML5_TRINI|nr:cytochrome P450 9e2-like [Trichoplusia ni]